MISLFNLGGLTQLPPVNTQNMSALNRGEFRQLLSPLVNTVENNETGDETTLLYTVSDIDLATDYVEKDSNGLLVLKMPVTESEESILERIKSVDSPSSFDKPVDIDKPLDTDNTELLTGEPQQIVRTISPASTDNQRSITANRIGPENQIPVGSSKSIESLLQGQLTVDGPMEMRPLLMDDRSNDTTNKSDLARQPEATRTLLVPLSPNIEKPEQSRPIDLQVPPSNSNVQVKPSLEPSAPQTVNAVLKTDVLPPATAAVVDRAQETSRAILPEAVAGQLIALIKQVRPARDNAITETSDNAKLAPVMADANNRIPNTTAAPVAQVTHNEAQHNHLKQEFHQLVVRQAIQYLNGKDGNIDLQVETAKGERFNIDVQLVNDRVSVKLTAPSAQILVEANQQSDRLRSSLEQGGFDLTSFEQHQHSQQQQAGHKNQAITTDAPAPMSEELANSPITKVKQTLLSISV